MKVRRPLVVLGVCGLLMFTIGCASNVTGAKVAQLQMKQTTEEQMKQLFGDPDASGMLNSKEGSSCYYRYYSSENHGPLFPPDLMTLLIEMRDNRMNGYVFCSTRKEDVTHVDQAALKQLVAGTTTREAVQTPLGPPAGRVLVPSMIKEVHDLTKADTQDVWVYTSGDDLKLGYWKKSSVLSAFIAFDTQGRVQGYSVFQRNLTF